MKTKPRKGETDSKKMQFGMWLGLPERCRKDDEKTLEAFSKKIEVTTMTLNRWKKEEDVKEIARNALILFAGNDGLECMQSIIEKTKEGNPTMARLYAEIMGWTGKATTSKGTTPKEITVKYVTDK